MTTKSSKIAIQAAWLVCFFLCEVLSLSSVAAAEIPKNLALDAKATASETQDDLTPEKAIDGKMDTRWSGIPGHNEGVWYQLEWKEPVEVGEVVIHQFGTFAMEWNVQVLDAKTAEWRTVQHFGKPGVKLPLVVTCRFSPCRVTGVRIADITNGPSFNEVEIYSRPFARSLATRVASDLQGHFIGIVSDAEGASPVEGAAVTLSGKSPAGPWKSTAKSDAKGLFTADMPVRLTGPVAVRTALKSPQFEVAPSESQVGSEGFEFCLTPREARRNAVALNDGWEFKLDPPEGFWAADFDDADWAKIKVPAHWEMQGFHNDTGVGGYRLHFTAPTEAGRVKLDFEGVYSGAEVWVNGQLVATHEGGALPFEADITDAVKPGDNVLALRVREHTVVSDKLDHMSLYADFHLAGIMRPVYLFTTPDVQLADLKIVTTFDKDYRDATMTVRGRLLNESPQAFQGYVAMGLAGPIPDKAEVSHVKTAPVEVGPWQTTEVTIVLPVAAPKKWNAEQPNRYELSTGVITERKVVEELAVIVGFRQTEIRGTEILINGKPVKFRGTCRHDAHPLLGRAVTAEIARRDLLLMKEANLNAVRTSHYPPVRELAENADELGVYVEAEGSFCWADDTNDLRNTPRILQMEAELLARDRNRPSIAYWSVCNESEFGYGLQRAHEWIRKTDPSRPTGAATSAWLEIATWHNPMAVSRIQENEKVNKPLLFDESLGIFQGIYGDGFLLWTDPGMRDYYAQPLPAVLDAFMKSKVTQGTYIWCWADDIFCVPNRGIEFGRDVTQCFFVCGSYAIRGRGIVGDAPWGVIDGWQRRKPEFWITKKVHSPIKVNEMPLPLPGPDGMLRVAVENQYDFRNLSDLRVRWTLGSQQGESTANIPPRSTGEIAIHLDEAAKAGEMLSLEFREADGRLIDAYRVPLESEPPHVAPGEKCSPVPLEITHTNYLQGAMTSIVDKDFQLAVNEATGRLKRCVVKGQVLLLELPLLHVSPEKGVTHPMPDVESWHLDKPIDVRKEGDNVLLSIDGRYTNFDGGYRITVTPDGEMRVVSTFKYSGDDLLAHEIGLRFSVPRDCDVLDWDRRGEWNVYPSDHIGRPVGTARAFPKLANTVPPTDPWSQEISPMGSNDFRSTKRHIYWAAIHYPDGPGVIVESNGHQHVRAMVQSDRTSLHVNDWYGGAGTSYWEWTRNYGEGKPIHKGDTLTSSVKLRLSPRTVLPEKSTEKATAR